MDYKVTLEVPIIVRDIKDGEDAIKVAMSSVIKKLKASKLEYVKVEIGMSQCLNVGIILKVRFCR